MVTLHLYVVYVSEFQYKTIFILTEKRDAVRNRNKESNPDSILLEVDSMSKFNTLEESLEDEKYVNLAVSKIVY